MNTVATRRTAIAAVLLVALVAAVVSYAHMRELALEHGEAWRSVLIPLAVDGMLVAATLAIVSQRRHRRPAGWVPWLGLTLGILASLAANVAAARPELVAQLIAAWPPVALAVSIETLVVVLRSGASPIHNVTRTSSAEFGQVSPSVHHEDAFPDPQLGTPDRLSTPVSSADPVAELIEQGAGRRRIAAKLGITEHRAKMLLAEHRNGEVTRVPE